MFLLGAVSSVLIQIKGRKTPLGFIHSNYLLASVASVAS
jgi:hypothetical protein